MISIRFFDHHDSVSGAGDGGVARSGAGAGGCVESGILDSSSIGGTEDATGGIGCGDGVRFGLKPGTIANNLDALLGWRPRPPVLKLMVRWKL
jgi:hypothetical protein